MFRRRERATSQRQAKEKEEEEPQHQEAGEEVFSAMSRFCCRFCPYFILFLSFFAVLVGYCI